MGALADFSGVFFSLPCLCVCAHTGLFLQPFQKGLFHHAPLVPSSLVGGVSYKVAADRFHSMGSTFGSWEPLAFA